LPASSAPTEEPLNVSLLIFRDKIAGLTQTFLAGLDMFISTLWGFCSDNITIPKISKYKDKY